MTGADGPDAIDRPVLLDTHVHFWDQAIPDLSWPWLEPGFSHPSLPGIEALAAARYAVPELSTEAAGAGVGGVVHVQAAATDDPVRESRWLEAMADDHGWPQAIVGACDLSAESAAEILRGHARCSRVRGVRDMAATFGLEVEGVAAGLDVASELGLSVELRLPIERFDVLAELARRWPDVTFVLGHAGLPMEGIAPGDEQRWAEALGRLAGTPNWVCKIAGLAARAGLGWTVDRITPWVEGCVAAFGPDRCMLGTNWPLDRLFGSYGQVVDAYDAITAGFEPAARDALFHGTASRVYDIRLDGTSHEV